MLENKDSPQGIVIERERLTTKTHSRECCKNAAAPGMVVAVMHTVLRGLCCLAI